MMLLRTLSACVLASGALLAMADGGATTRPTSASGGELSAARESVAKAVAALVGDLGSDDYEKREAAQAELGQLGELVMTEVLRQADMRDPEQAQRASRLFDRLTGSHRQGQLLMTFSKSDRAAVVKLAKAKPKDFNALFDPNPGAASAAAVRLIHSDQPGAVPVACWAMRHRQWRVRLAAAQAAGSISRKDVRVNNALMTRLGALGGNNADDNDMPPWVVRRAMGGDGDDDQGGWLVAQIHQCERRAVMKSLVELKDERMLPRLLKQLVAERNMMGMMGFGDHDELVPMILAYEDKRTIVTLRDHVNGNRQINAISFGPGMGGGKEITVKSGDVALAVILKQTEQSLKDYGFYISEHMGMGVEMGFDSQKKRQAARKKFEKWWTAHKDEYKGVKKIPLNQPAEAPAPGQQKLPGFIQWLQGG